ncbi:hypothetical protein K7432_017965, partial [Basidiobolus ranarum]
LIKSRDYLFNENENLSPKMTPEDGENQFSPDPIIQIDSNQDNEEKSIPVNPPTKILPTEVPNTMPEVVVPLSLTSTTNKSDLIWIGSTLLDCKTIRELS